jgi:hypothetical protein
MALALDVPDLGRFYLCHCGRAEAEKFPRSAENEAAQTLSRLRSYVLAWKRPPPKGE